MFIFIVAVFINRCVRMSVAVSFLASNSETQTCKENLRNFIRQNYTKNNKIVHCLFFLSGSFEDMTNMTSVSKLLISQHIPKGCDSNLIFGGLIILLVSLFGEFLTIVVLKLGFPKVLEIPGS